MSFARAAGRVSVVSEVGRQRGSPKAINQDAYLAARILPVNSGAITVVGILDGHGKDGHRASRHAAKALRAYLQQWTNTPDEAAQTTVGLELVKKDDSVSTPTNTAALATMDLEQQEAEGAQAPCLLTPDAARKLLVEAFKLTAASVKAAHLQRKMNADTSDTTACISVVLPDRARHLVAGGQVFQASDRHGNPVGPCRVVPKAAYGNTTGLAVSRTFGDLRLASAGVIAEPDVTIHQRCGCSSTTGSSTGAGPQQAGRPAEPLVVASDGLWEVVSNEEALTLAAEPGCAEVGALALHETAKARWAEVHGGQHRDDITVAVTYL
ncbi:hypothetical protein N2152v2_004432 [Parachlorella kessleri]